MANKECAKRYREKNRDTINSKARKWRKENPDKSREAGLKKKYGLTNDGYNNIFISQKGLCPICGTHQKDLRVLMHVDHDHSTGIIRGLLCEDCNRGLGIFRDNIDMLSNAIKYLNKNLEM